MSLSPAPFQPGGAFKRPLGFTTGPRVTGIDPISARITGLVAVTISGVNFTGASVVLFGVTAATSVVVVNDTTITCVCPAVAVAQVVDVTVSKGSQSGVAEDLFTYFDAVITRVTPYYGPIAGGTTVIIEGQDFPSSLTTVTFNGVTATSITRIDAGRISCVTPAKSDGDAGFVDVVVT